MPSQTATQLEEQFKAAGQGHVFHYFSQLDNAAQSMLIAQLKEIDPDRINSIFKQATKPIPPSSAPKINPLPKDCFDDIENISADKIEKWKMVGLKAIADGKVGVILLAGGQGTRLGSAAPKGCYDISLPSHKSLFQLQAERIQRLQDLSKLAYGGNAVIPWYVMTSGPTRKDTEAFFVEKNYFGLDRRNVIFFEQALTTDGKIILEDKGRVSVAPDGNGGIYAGLRTCQIFNDLEKRGIKYIHAYCVDNCLVRVADPIFMGYCISKNAKCGAKVVRKVFAHEPVGVVCKVDGKFGVVEYSEIKKEDAEMKKDDGKLALDAANIANHFYSFDFLKEVCSLEFENKLMFHVANKKIKHIDMKTNELVSPSKPNGVKLELFIFDIFPFIKDEKAFAVLSVPRSSEFSPLKNASGTGVDNPETSRKDIFSQSVRFLQQEGAKIVAADQAQEQFKVKEITPEGEKDVDVKIPSIEISPLVSYDGEGLDCVKGKQIFINKPVYIDTKEKLLSLIK